MKLDRDRLFEWSWGIRPATVEEFDQMMASLDKHLASFGSGPEQRPLTAAMLVSSKLGFDGTPILGGSPDRGDPFSPADVLARVHEWYEENYGDKIKIDFSPGSVVISLHGNLWEIKMPKVWGHFEPFISTDLTQDGPQIAVRNSPPVRHNILRSVQGMTQAYANRLNHDDFFQIGGWFGSGYQAMVCLDDLKGHDLFDEARGDYRHSVDALLTSRELSKARWDTAQCAEKILKGLLARDGHTYPTHGSKGHDIELLGGLLNEKLGIDLQKADLTRIYCSPDVRYGVQKSTIEEALAAHQSLVRVLKRLADAEVHHRHWNKFGS